MDRRAIKEETISINRHWVKNQACRLSHEIQVISKIVSEYDQEIPQSQTADNPVAP